MRAALTRDAIVETARAILLAEGADAVSLRHVATDLGVTAPALYAHIDGKGDLLAAVAELEYADLLARFDGIESDDLVEVVRQMCRIYVDHALERPHAFDLLFHYRTKTGEGDDITPPQAAAVEGFLKSARPTYDAVEQGLFKDIDPLMASLTIFSAIHGVATALLLGYDFGDRADELIDTVIDTVIEGLKA